LRFRAVVGVGGVPSSDKVACSRATSGGTRHLVVAGDLLPGVSSHNFLSPATSDGRRQRSLGSSACRFRVVLLPNPSRPPHAASQAARPAVRNHRGGSPTKHPSLPSAITAADQLPNLVASGRNHSPSAPGNVHLGRRPRHPPQPQAAPATPLSVSRPRRRSATADATGRIRSPRTATPTTPS
jgi:hypothetical protein